MNLVQTQQPAINEGKAVTDMELTVFSHSKLFYWWPVWAMGYILALITYLQGETITFADAEVIIHPSKNLGVFFTTVVLLVVLMTNVTVRGIASITVIVSILAMVFLFAYLGWWDDIFYYVSFLAMYMNLGFYVFFSTAVLGVWALSFFLFDRLDYWSFRPGQVVHHMVFGGGEKAFDTHGITVYKLRDDLFRHWILGLGSGDLHIAVAGATRQEFVVENVLFISRRLEQIQQLVAMKPDETPASVVRAGTPD
jgi:hypothetical protein